VFFECTGEDQDVIDVYGNKIWTFLRVKSHQNLLPEPDGAFVSPNGITQNSNSVMKAVFSGEFGFANILKPSLV
jgi:hypothetical protein